MMGWMWLMAQQRGVRIGKSYEHFDWQCYFEKHEPAVLILERQFAGAIARCVLQRILQSAVSVYQCNPLVDVMKHTCRYGPKTNARRACPQDNWT